MPSSHTVVTRGLPFLLAASLLLPGCPLKDDYSIENDEPSGGRASGGTEAGGRPDSSSSGNAGVWSAGSASGAGNALNAGGGLGLAGSGADTAVGGDQGSGTSGCISAIHQEHEYAFCFDALSQASARADCGARGMTLAVIEDRPEDDWIAQTFSAAYRGPSRRAFVGANDVSNEGEWRWADGVTFWRGGAAVSGHFTNWSEGQPDDASPLTGNSADCLSLGMSDGKWDDVSCDDELPYVCEPR